MPSAYKHLLMLRLNHASLPVTEVAADGLLLVLMRASATADHPRNFHVGFLVHSAADVHAEHSVGATAS